MKRTILLPVVLVFLSLYTLRASVKPPKKFGDIDKHNLELRTCPIDSSASACYIFDWGEAYFDFNTGEIMLMYHARIKIINDQGFSYANKTIPFTVNSPVKHLKAATYNLVDGKIKVTNVDKSMIFNEKVINDQRQLKISFPDVHEGSIIEYSYLKSAGNVYHLVPWTFQSDIPVMYSELNLRIPDNLQYKFIQEGYHTMDVATKKSFMDRGSVQSTEYHWVMKDIPALKEEPYMPDANNFYARLRFELAGMNVPGKGYQEVAQTWEKLEKKLKKNEHFLMMIDKWKFLQDSVSALTAGDDRATIRHLHDFIGRHVKWNGEDGIFCSSSPHQLWKTGSGNDADINLMFAGLLRQAGFDVHPLILSTRDNGMIKNKVIPILSDYNYVITWASKNDKTYLLDGTEPLLDPFLLPARCLNGEGRRISDDPAWISLIPSTGYNEMLFYRLTLEEDGTLHGTIQASKKGYSAFSLRKRMEEQGKDKVIEKKKGEHGDWAITSWEIGPEKEASKPLVEKISCTIEDKVENMGDLFVLNPLIDPEWKENPFKKEKRIYPIDFVAPRFKKIILSYQLPEGYAVDELPKSVRLSTPDKTIVYTYAVQVRGRMVQILSSLNIKKPLITQNEYPQVRSFFDEVLAKQAEQIIIKKQP